MENKIKKICVYYGSDSSIWLEYKTKRETSQLWISRYPELDGHTPQMPEKIRENLEINFENIWKGKETIIIQTCSELVCYILALFSLKYQLDIEYFDGEKFYLLTELGCFFPDLFEKRPLSDVMREITSIGKTKAKEKYRKSK